MTGNSAAVAAPHSFRRVVPDYSFQKVAGAIREAIVQRELKPGDRLPAQRELQAVFGVSKVTVIGALRQLEADGVIATQVGRHGGAIVLDPSRQPLTRALGFLLDMEQVNLTEVKELRDSVEVQTARLAAQRATPEQIAQLNSVLCRLDTLAAAPAGAPEPASYLELDLEFHAILAEASGNRLLSAWMQVLRHHLLQHPTAVSPPKQRVLNRSLQALLVAITAGSPDAAAQAMAVHLVDSYRNVDIQRQGAAQRAPGPNAPACAPAPVCDGDNHA
jgi:GntR family transcriptional repressor for pyruvate dehydrogenase complex